VYRGGVIASNQAVRLGLRAASRNPELAFGRALVDQASALLSLLPVVLAALIISGTSLDSLFFTVAALQWPLIGAAVTAFAISFGAGAFFWAGAMPLLAADAELDRRPPPGNFALLGSRGFVRVLLTSMLAQLLATSLVAGCLMALLIAVPRALLHPSMGRFAQVALIATVMIVFGVLVDLLARLWLIRAAAFGEGPAVSFGKAVPLLFARLGQGLIVTAAFFVLQLIASAVAGGLGGVFSGSALFDADVALVALAPRIALGLAFAAVFSWLEVGKMAALSAVACDAEGLLGPEEAVVEAQPLPAEPVIEALPLDD
jgi:hypothetical protein